MEFGVNCPYRYTKFILSLLFHWHESPEWLVMASRLEATPTEALPAPNQGIRTSGPESAVTGPCPCQWFSKTDGERGKLASVPWCLEHVKALGTHCHSLTIVRAQILRPGGHSLSPAGCWPRAGTLAEPLTRHYFILTRSAASG